ncbi:MAG: amidohydrolase family protein [Desulfobacterales bacterium]|nr:MAG: amidohydrolase family protein [Desulfobacterales bacterium]
MKTMIKILGTLALLLMLALPAMAVDIPSEVTLFKNVNIFDGENEKLLQGYDVLVIRNLIKQVSKDIPTEGTYELDVKTGGVKKLNVDVGCMHHYTVYVAGEKEKTEKKEVKVNVIDGKRKTLMPGLIDAHWHTLYVNMLGLDPLRTEETDYIHAVALKEADKTLLRGFTTVRDLGGSCFGLKKAIDQGVCPGPRILPSGTHIGITGGHADYTESWNLPRSIDGSMDRFEQIESFRQVAGVPEMLAAVRYNLKRGASQIKLLMGGGVASTYDPLDVNEFTFEEVKAAVDVAKNWGTYVTVHIYTDEGIKKAIKAGVKGIEHGHLMSEEAAKLIAKNDMWVCIQPFDPDMPGALEILGPEKFKKYLEMANGFPKVMDFVKKYNINLAFGTDFSFTPQNNHTQANALTKFSKWLSNYEILKMATSTNAKYFELSGERHPYKQGPLGVIKPGAYADILLVDGNPLEDVSILGDNNKNISLIMKNGKIYKNTIH